MKVRGNRGVCNRCGDRLRIGVAGLLMAGLPLSAQTPAGLKTARLLEEAREPVRIVCFGDSITGVYYHSGGRRAWPEMLKIALNRLYPKADVTVFNAGVSGDSSLGGVRRIEKDVLAYRPQLVVVMFGMNDLAYGPAAPEKDEAVRKTFAERLKKIAETCRAAGAEVILCTQNPVYPEAVPHRPPERIGAFAEVIRHVGAELQAPVADIYAEWEKIRQTDAGAWRLMMSETIHPSMAGHKRMAEQVARTISGKAVSLADVTAEQPVCGALITRLKAGGPVRLMASAPLASAVRTMVLRRFPSAKITVLPVAEGAVTLDEAVAGNKRIRGAKPDLVFLTLAPQALGFGDGETAVRQLSWFVNWALPFAGSPWTVVGVDPELILSGLTPGQREGAARLREAVRAHDLDWIAALPDTHDGLQTALDQWFGKQDGDGGAGPAVHIGGRRELFADGAIIAATSGDLRRVLHRPERREIVFETDRPWEGNASGFQSVFADNGKYRMYYRGLHYGKSLGIHDTTLAQHEWVLCYAESADGIRWTRPELGICEFQGSTSNNIILNRKMLEPVKGCPAHSVVFLDTNPACPPDQRYKMVVARPSIKPPRGLFIMASGDGLRFRLLSEKAIIEDGSFDSQNLIFWDQNIRKYRVYYRGTRNGLRSIRTSESEDILNFPAGRLIELDSDLRYEFYTNQMQPYYRAPHIILGFPMRYHYRGTNSWDLPAMRALPGYARREARHKFEDRHGTAVTDAVLLASRDGTRVTCWNEAFLRPGPRIKESWVYGDNFLFWGMLELPSVLEDAPNEISLYATEGYFEGNATRIRRCTLRLDGFVSAQASARGGGLTTVPLIFDGRALSLNFGTSAAGELRVEIQHPDGTPVPGYSMEECFPIFGDHIEFTVAWKGKGSDVSALAGKPVRLRFALKDADLYAFRFTDR